MRDEIVLCKKNALTTFDKDEREMVQKIPIKWYNFENVACTGECSSINAVVQKRRECIMYVMAVTYVYTCMHIT